MKSTIKIDIDDNDIPCIVINSVAPTLNVREIDLRDKSLQSFLSKLGFIHGHWGQEATLRIKYIGWASGDMQYNTYEIYPQHDSAKIVDEKSYQLTTDNNQFTN